jgi:NADH:ubiquinone oxidoreductase subunit
MDYDPATVPAKWHGWLHHMYDELPTEQVKAKPKSQTPQLQSRESAPHEGRARTPNPKLYTLNYTAKRVNHIWDELPSGHDLGANPTFMRATPLVEF